MNINRLIKYIGGSYPELINNSVITYKTEPKGYAGSPNLNLEMAKEGVFLSFRRDGKIFNEMTLYIQHDKVENWISLMNYLYHCKVKCHTSGYMKHLACQTNPFLPG